MLSNLEAACQIESTLRYFEFAAQICGMKPVAGNKQRRRLDVVAIEPGDFFNALFPKCTQPGASAATYIEHTGGMYQRDHNRHNDPRRTESAVGLVHFFGVIICEILAHQFRPVLANTSALR